MPEKRITVFPIEGAPLTLYSDEGWGGQTSVTWINEKKKHWQCNLAQSEFSPVCGLAAELSNNKKTFDFSKYTSLSVQIKYTGEASKLRVYLRNHNPAYSNPEDPDSFKFNSVNIPASDFSSKETLINLSEFSVESWWIEERNIPRHLVHPELNSIITMGIDYPYPQRLGEHSIEMDKIELIGPLFPKTHYFFTLCCFWIFIFCAEALYVILLEPKLKKFKNQQNHSQPSKSIDQQKSTKTQEKDLASKNDLTLKINSVFSSGESRQNVSLILLKVESKTGISHTKSTEAILTSLYSSAERELKETDTFARWGKEEFLILSTNTNKEAALKLADRLRSSVLKNTGDIEESNLSIGGTSVISSDDFGAAFMRAEQALYQAGNNKKHTQWLDTKKA